MFVIINSGKHKDFSHHLYIYNDVYSTAGRSATFQYSSKIEIKNEATIYGSKGKMTLKFPFWCADKLELSNGEVLEFPLAKAKYDYNFLNSSGLGFEAQHVRECLLKAQYIY